MKRYQEKGVRLLFRADAAFAKPEVYAYLESRDTGYAMRLPANEVRGGLVCLNSAARFDKWNRAAVR